MPTPAAPPAVRGAVELQGTPARPELVLRVDTKLQLPGRSRSYQRWVRALPDRRWNPEQKAWVITGISDITDPAAFFRDVGLEVRYPTTGDLTGWALPDLMTPFARFDPDRPWQLNILPRLAGKEACISRVGWGAVWRNDEQWFDLPLPDATSAGQLKPGVLWPDRCLEESLNARRRPEPRPELEKFARALAGAVDGSEFGGLGQLAEWTAKIPGWFGKGDPDRDSLDPYPYQQLGALGVALGHNLLADEPGLGKTAQALAAASIRQSKRTLVTCPPLVATNWARESSRAGLPQAVDGDIAVIVPGRKVPELPERGVVIVPDSTVAARPALREQLEAWAPDVLIYDEAHRAMTVGSKRSDAVVSLARHAGFTIPVTGTPMLSSPHQLVPLLEMTGHMVPVFGSRGEFLERYCRRDAKYGRFTARKQNLAELGEMLAQHVWVRRSKRTVLPWLPLKFRQRLDVRVNLGQYRDAHQDVIDKVDAWITSVVIQTGELPTAEAREQFGEASLSLISQLRRAAGLCKIPAAVEWIQQLHDFAPDTDGRFARPLLVWTHHQEVTAAMAEAVPASVGRVGVIRGGTSAKERDELVDLFQDGRIAVLVCSITAAGVGITLTRAQDALFVESDWTPALIEQAEDRANRIGSTENLQVTTLVAEGTLDEHIQRSLAAKGYALGAVYGSDESVAVVERGQVDDLQTARDILEGLVDERLLAASKRLAREQP
ncbi:MAG: DEAD/DEAH box helicase [Microbacteriaceae bacterium]